MIKHAEGTDKKLEVDIAYYNSLQRPDGSGSPSELFLSCEVRILLLASFPTPPDIEANISRREELRERQVKRSQRTGRTADKFTPGQKIVRHNNVSKLWNIKRTIVSARAHEGSEARSYFIKLKSGKYTNCHDCFIRPRRVQDSPRLPPCYKLLTHPSPLYLLIWGER